MLKEIKNINILYNPVSTGFSVKKLDKIYEVIKNNGIKAEAMASHKKGDITKLVQEFDDENTLVITLGGDGTVSEAYKGFNNITQKGLYAHVPTGTTNDMSKNYNVRYKDAGLITNDILNGEITIMDSYKMNDEIVAYTSVFGYLAHVPYVTKQEIKKYLGHAGYVLSALPFIIKAPKKYVVTYETDNDKKTCECFLGAVSNSKGFAGIDLYSNSNLSDGKLELLLITNANAKLIASLVKDYLKNDIDLSRYKDYVITDSSNKIKLTFDSPYPEYNFDNDGEKSLFLPNQDNPMVSYEIAKPIKVLKRKGN